MVYSKFFPFLKPTLRFLRSLLILFVLILLFIGAWWILRLLSRPWRIDKIEELANGARYERIYRKEPRSALIHIVELDSSKVEIEEILITPPNSSKGLEHLADFTSNFAKTFEVDLAINGSFYTPCHTHRVWDFYPQQGEPVEIFATAVYDGVQYSKPEESKHKRHVLYWEGTRFKTFVDGELPKGVKYALPGGDLLVRNGKSETLVHRRKHSFAPRSGIGWYADGSKLWIVAVDGRQPKYSVGLNLEEFSQLFVGLGADEALSLDGGGSSTLVARKKGKLRLLNAPIHRRVPMNERPVANHLGFRFQER
jgi:hypothetical protein